MSFRLIVVSCWFFVFTPIANNQQLTTNNYSKMKKQLIITAFLGAITVALGAFGAHALKDKLELHEMHTYEKAVQYQFIHVLALLALLLYMIKTNEAGLLLWTVRLFFTGIVLFSGSLFLLSFLRAAGFDNYNWLGAITPLGGIAFMLGWLMMGMSFIKNK